MAEIGYASLAIIPSMRDFNRDLTRGAEKAAVLAGKASGDKFSDQFSRDANGRLRDFRGRFVKESAAGGAAAGSEFGGKFSRSFGAKSRSLIGPLLGLFAGAQVGRFFKDSTAEAREAQKVGALTARVIKTTGGAAKVTAKQVGNLATRISNKTAIDDEAIQSGANLLLTFKNVRNEVGKGNKVFDQATQAAVDLSAAGFGDLAGTSKQLGKALNDPVKGITALGRAGVTFTEQQKNQIKSFVASGNALRAQKMILREVTSQVGGAAAAQATSGEKVRVAFDNIKEGVGTALLPAIEDVEQAFLKKGIPALQKFTVWAQDDAVPALRDFGKKATPIVRDVLGKARDYLKAAQPYAEGFVKAFNSLPDGVKKGAGAAALLGFGASKIPGVKGGVGAGAGAAKGILGLVTKAKPLPVFVVNNGVGGGLPGKGKTPASLGKDAKFLTGLGPYGALAAGTVGGGILMNKYGPRAAPVGPSTKGNLNTQAPALAAPIIKAIGKLDTEPLRKAAFYSNLARQNLAKLPEDFNKGMNGAQALKSQVFGIESSTKRSRAAVVSLVDALEAARQRAVRVEQAVSAARQSKVDAQLGGGVQVNHYGDIVAPSPRSYHEDAQRRSRRAATDGIRSRP